jgi:ABC-type oligopeptide transport system ATPase subunit
VGVVGESGSGKSTLGRALLRLLQPEKGDIRIEGNDPFRLRGAQLLSFRRRVQAIFQDSASSLNPRLRIADSLREGMDIHKMGTKKNRKQRVTELLQMVGLEPEYGNRLPHTLSGGQRQRVNIARALSLDPDILIADEPVSALDVSIQAQILELLRELKVQRNLTMVFISHDLMVVKDLCNKIAVLSKGKIVEYGDTIEVFAAPQHEYTKQLISSAPVVRPPSATHNLAAGPPGSLDETAQQAEEPVWL